MLILLRTLLPPTMTPPRPNYEFRCELYWGGGLIARGCGYAMAYAMAYATACATAYAMAYAMAYLLDM